MDHSHDESVITGYPDHYIINGCHSSCALCGEFRPDLCEEGCSCSSIGAQIQEYLSNIQVLVDLAFPPERVAAKLAEILQEAKEENS